MAAAKHSLDVGGVALAEDRLKARRDGVVGASPPQRAEPVRDGQDPAQPQARAHRACQQESHGPRPGEPAVRRARPRALGARRRVTSPQPQ
eukprot:scaffold9371_cov115-Isochrysis_galbana.AAC.1